MKNKMLYLIITVASVLCFAMAGFAAMQSENYKITAAVASGGGEPVSSTNYKTNSTIGQSSPVMDTGDASWSTNYKLYSGFWYVADGIADCIDVENGDVSGDGEITLSDAILVLKNMVGMDASSAVNKCADSNGDGKIGLADMVFILREITN